MISPNKYVTIKSYFVGVVINVRSMTSFIKIAYAALDIPDGFR